VFSGNAHLERGTAVVADAHGGESLVLSADASHVELSESIEPDSWDTWNSDRDQVLNAEASSKTAATNGFADSTNPAWNDLDANGNWYNVPGQGNIWSPNEANSSGFDPYGNGYWVNTPGFGYIWASGYSWGYLPFQCGNWNFYDNFGWGWAPGAGGCAPWWGGGGYYGPNIGIGYGGYRPPGRPHPHPGPPIGHGGRPFPNPILAVNRRSSGGNTEMPLRARAGVAVIAGQTVQPLRPLSPRVPYQHQASGYVNGTVGNQGSRNAAGAPGAASPSFVGGQPGVGAGPSWSRPSNANAGPAPTHTSSGGYVGGGAASHPAPGGGYSGGGSSAGRSSGGGGAYSGGSGGGGGGGGASHSGGGGGGGGGGSHK
jgi:hypothetical protein